MSGQNRPLDDDDEDYAETCPYCGAEMYWAPAPYIKVSGTDICVRGHAGYWCEGCGAG